MPDPVTPPAAPPATPAPAPAAPAAPSAPAGGEPGPIPYQRFHEVNTRATTLEAENARLQAQLAGFNQQMQVQVQDQVAKVRQEQALRVGLARAGVVSDPYADFLVSRYQSMGQQAPPVESWVQQLKAAEPAFFGGLAAPPPPAAPQAAPPAPAAPSAAPAAAPPQAVPPAAAPARGSPDAGAGGAAVNPSTQDPPLTLELIEDMDTTTYARRRGEIRKFLAEQRR